MLKFRWETKFKETEIGEIPEEWEVTTLKAIVKIGGLKRVLDSENVAFISMAKIYTDSYIPSFEISSLDDVKSGGEVTPNSILVAKITPSFEHGKMCIVPNIRNIRWFATTEVFSLCPKNGNNLFFIFYLLKHPNLREILENSMSGTSGRQRVRLSALKNLAVPYLSPDEQSRIGTVLCWFDTLIENKKKQNDLLEKTALAIFKSWFIDFEPFKDSELGETPKEWKVKRINELFDFVKGKKCDLSVEYIEGYMPYLLIETYETGIKEYWTEEKQPLVDELDIVFVADGASSGKVFSFQKGILGSTFLTLKTRDNTNDMRHFVYLLFKNMEDSLMEHRTGSAIPHLDKDYLSDLQILIPSTPILEKFHSVVDPIIQKILINQKQITVLREIRDTLLPLLVFGRLRVEDV